LNGETVMSDTSKNIIEIKQISKTFTSGQKTVEALKDISLEIKQGEFVSIIGASGCGKSTLLRIIGGLEKQDTGKILFEGKSIPGPSREKGFIFQDIRLLPWLTVEANIKFSLPKGLKNIDALVAEKMEVVSLRGFEKAYPRQLSGGMAQRAAIARALVNQPMLMDEPFGAIDPKNRLALQDLTVKLCKKNENRKAVIFVTHDIDEAIFLADRIIFMEPKKIKEEIDVTFPADLSREEIIRSQKYMEIRNKLMSLFLQDVGNRIGEEVMI